VVRGIIATMAVDRPAADPLGPEAIRAAKATIHPAFTGSPQFVHEGLSARAGRTVVVKVETVNPIRAFKGRGTWHAIAGLVGDGILGPDRPVVVASTGNFGQGVAFAGRAHGVPVTVFADAHANPRKLSRIRALGATVVQDGHDFDAARAASGAHARGSGAHLLVDGEDPRIAAGAGTLALELTDAIAAGHLPSVGAAYVPVGNGALIVGVGAWLRASAPACRVVGIQSDAAPSMTLSWEQGRPIATETAATTAEGIATRVPVPEALVMMMGRVDAMRLVPERSLAGAQAELTAELGITVEAAAAASWAGLLADADPPDGAALIVVTGSNIAP
jgi:threonine dehydratase